MLDFFEVRFDLAFARTQDRVGQIGPVSVLTEPLSWMEMKVGHFSGGRSSSG